RAVASVRDVVNPDVVTLGGEAFTRHGAEREGVSDGYRQRSSYSDVPLRFSEPDDDLRSAAALGAASRVMYIDPIGATQSRRDESGGDPCESDSWSERQAIDMPHGPQ